MKKLIQRIAGDSLRHNSLLLISSQAVNAGAGFLFWIICARLFPTEAVGYATASISLAVLLSNFTIIGLNNTIIRFLPTSHNKAGLFGISLLLVSTCSILGGLLALFLLHILSPELMFIRQSNVLSILLLLLVIFTALTSFVDATLLSYRKASYIFMKALIINTVRLSVPFFVLGLGLQGILLPHVTMLVLGCGIGGFLIARLLQTRLSLDVSQLKNNYQFAFGNYVGGLFGMLPSTLLPLIVLHTLGAKEAAYFYMPMQLATFLGVISSSTSQAYLAESSQASAAAIRIKQALLHTYQLLIPAAVLLASGGWFVLQLYGTAYAVNGWSVLIILCIASLFIAFNWVGDTWLNIQQHMRGYIAMNAINATLVIGFCYVAAEHGLLAIALAWLASQIVSSVIYILLFQRSALRRLLAGMS